MKSPTCYYCGERIREEYHPPLGINPLSIVWKIAGDVNNSPHKRRYCSKKCYGSENGVTSDPPNSPGTPNREHEGPSSGTSSGGCGALIILIGLGFCAYNFGWFEKTKAPKETPIVKASSGFKDVEVQLEKTIKKIEDLRENKINGFAFYDKLEGKMKNYKQRFDIMMHCSSELERIGKTDLANKLKQRFKEDITEINESIKWP